LRPRTVEEKATIAAELRERVWPLLESGNIKIVIDKFFEFSQAAEAHRMLERGEHAGKIVLSLREKGHRTEETEETEDTEGVGGRGL